MSLCVISGLRIATGLSRTSASLNDGFRRGSRGSWLKIMFHRCGLSVRSAGLGRMNQRHWSAYCSPLRPLITIVNSSACGAIGVTVRYSG
jgi:hypothetical protein